MLKFRGSSNFRQRVALATISGRAIRIDDIRANSETPGLRDFEACFLRLIEKVTNGCVVEINETGADLLASASERPFPDYLVLPEGAQVHAVGTTLHYRPGIISGGSLLQHDCGKARGIGYFLEPLVLICLFGKQVSGKTSTSLPPPPQSHLAASLWPGNVLPLLTMVAL